MADRPIVSIDSTVPSTGRASGAAAEEDLGELVVDHVRRVVLVHGDLLEDHAPLRVDVGGPDHRGGDQVTDDVHRERQVGVEHPRVEAGVLLGR